MREKSIRLAKAGKEVLFIYDSISKVKTLLHYKLDNSFMDYSGKITVVNASSFVSFFLIATDHLSRYYILCKLSLW